MPNNNPPESDWGIKAVRVITDFRYVIESAKKERIEGIRMIRCYFRFDGGVRYLNVAMSQQVLDDAKFDLDAALRATCEDAVRDAKARSDT